MANLFELLSKEDCEKIEWYIRNFAGLGGDSSDMKASLDYILRFWAYNKQSLYKMLGDNLIISRKVSYSRTYDEMSEDYYDYFGRNGDGFEFRNTFNNKVRDLYLKTDISNTQYFNLVNLLDVEPLMSNIYDGESFKFTYNDKTLMINKGMKLSKMLGKMSDILEIDRDIYEKFRIAHSQFLNQKNISGELCLSIHPLDYITMSDNDCGWDSCMRWQNGGGEYRQGTVEMMNSPIILEAYLKSDKDMELWYKNGQPVMWNSKRWRELFIVDESLILGIKGYPYCNENLESICLAWIKKLAEQNLGFGPYTKYLNQIHNYSNNIIGELDRNIYFNLDTNFMYNDIYSEHNAYVSTKIPTDESVNLNYSGESECMCCGELFDDSLLDDRENNAEMTICTSCSGTVKCDKCGDIVYVDDTYNVDGRTYCAYCYDENTEVCPCCGVRKDYDDMKQIRLRFQEKPVGFYADICWDCCEDKKVKTFFSGEIEEDRDGWRSNYYVDGETLTKKGRDLFNISEEEFISWAIGTNPNQRPSLIF